MTNTVLQNGQNQNSKEMSNGLTSKRLALSETVILLVQSSSPNTQATTSTSASSQQTHVGGTDATSEHSTNMSSTSADVLEFPHSSKKTTPSRSNSCEDLASKKKVDYDVISILKTVLSSDNSAPNASG